jgi:hypothetical protein
MKILTFKKIGKKKWCGNVQSCTGIKAKLLAQIWNHPRNISRKGECSNADRGDRKPDGIN